MIIKIGYMIIKPEMCEPEEAGYISRAGSHGLGRAAFFGRILRQN